MSLRKVFKTVSLFMGVVFLAGALTGTNIIGHGARILSDAGIDAAEPFSRTVRDTPGVAEQETEAPSVQLGNWTVTRVVDGDTFVASNSVEEIRVRMLGVDTPETKKPGADVECFGPEASEYLTSRLEGKVVSLEAGTVPQDHYGRTLAWVWDGPELVNRTLLSEGYAEMFYGEDTRFDMLLSQAQEIAQTNGTGLWGNCL